MVNTELYYHVPTIEAVRAILRNGSFTGDDHWMTGQGQILRGIWLTHRPINRGIEFGVGRPVRPRVLTVTLNAPLEALDCYELIEPKVSRREWLVPARELRRYKCAVDILLPSDRAARRPRKAALRQANIHTPTWEIPAFLASSR